MTKTLNLFGVTGSIGQSAQKIIKAHTDHFDVQLVTANKNVDGLARAAIDLGAKYAVIADDALYDDLKKALGAHDIQISAGQKAIEDAAGIPCDISLMGIMGFAGLRPLMKALEQGNAVAIANKEPLVAAGPLVMEKAKQFGALILPVDSEHNALFQVFEPERKNAIKRLIITASGGPFRGLTQDQMRGITPEQALKHPTWEMGEKISIDSATLANKALEIIEAHYLFDMQPEKIEAILHPQSVVHSMIEYADGSILAQMGASDMCTPIIYALGYPDRLLTPGKTLDLKSLSNLEFEEIDRANFPFIDLAYDCLGEGLYKNIAFNAANEICVDLFLKGGLSFLDIMDVTRHITEQARTSDLSSLDAIEHYDQIIRQTTHNHVNQSDMKAG